MKGDEEIFATHTTLAPMACDPFLLFTSLRFFVHFPRCHRCFRGLELVHIFFKNIVSGLGLVLFTIG